MFVAIETLDGGKIVLAVGSIFRIRPSLSVAEIPDATKLEFGAQQQFTREDISALVMRLDELGWAYLPLTAPNGMPVYLGRAYVTVVRPSDPTQDAPEARSTITIAGKRQAVQQAPEEIAAMLGVPA